MRSEVSGVSWCLSQGVSLDIIWTFFLLPNRQTVPCDAKPPPRSSGKWRLMGIPCFKHIYTIYIYIILWWLLLGGGSSQMLPVFHPCLFFNPTHDFIPPHSRTALPCFANLSRRRLSASHATSAVESWTLLCTPWLYLRMFGGEHCKERWSNVVKDPTCADP